MAPYLRVLKRWLGSIQLTISLLGMLFLLVLFATFSQVDLGIYEANQRYFMAWFVWMKSWPIFLGGYSIGGLLVVNLLVSHATKGRTTLGIFLIHAGLVIMIVGSALTHWLGDEMQVAITEGQTARFVEFPTAFELAIIDRQSPTHDVVTTVDPNDLPVTVHGIHIDARVRHPNAFLNQRGIINKKYVQLGEQFKLISLPKTYKMSERNVPGMVLDIASDEGKNRYVVWGGSAVYQTIPHNGTEYLLKLRPKRHYLPFTVSLDTFNRRHYDESSVVESFQSMGFVDTDSGRIPFDITMNHPLRHGGYTFFQASFTDDDATSIFQVVKNPGWLVPYVASLVICLGLLIQMMQSRKRGVS